MRPGPRRVLLLCVLLAAKASRGEGSADDVVGAWWLPGGAGQVEIYERAGRYFGRVIEIDPHRIDASNPDPTLRERPVLGIHMFEDFRFDASEGRWEDGTIYDFESGRRYRCVLWFEPRDAQTLFARGYVGLPLFGRTAEFVRADLR